MWLKHASNEDGRLQECMSSASGRVQEATSCRRGGRVAESLANGIPHHALRHPSGRVHRPPRGDTTEQVASTAGQPMPMLSYAYRAWFRELPHFPPPSSNPSLHPPLRRSVRYLRLLPSCSVHWNHHQVESLHLNVSKFLIQAAI